MTFWSRYSSALFSAHIISTGQEFNTVLKSVKLRVMLVLFAYLEFDFHVIHSHHLILIITQQKEEETAIKTQYSEHHNTLFLYHKCSERQNNEQ